MEYESKNTAFTHVKITIYPDGGIKRVRVIGRRINFEESTIKGGTKESPRNIAAHPATWITAEAFSLYGQVIKSWEPETAPSTVRMTIANQGTALKFHNLAPVESSYPVEKGAKTGFSVYRSSSGPEFGSTWKVMILERHPCTNQGFIPMGLPISHSSNKPRAYLVVVALNGENDNPDLNTLRAFVVPTSHGIVYNAGTWRQ